ncbi:MAG: ABC transporter ATP-binding protein [Eubacteriales bacterium]
MTKTDKKAIKPYIRQIYRKNHLRFAGGLFAAIMMGVVNLALSALMKELIDTISGGEDAVPLSVLLTVAVGLMLAICAIQFVNYHSKPRFMERAMAQYKNYVFEKLTRKSMASFRDESAASYVSGLCNDASTIELNYLNNQFDLIAMLITAGGALAMMLVYSPLLTLIAVALSALPVIASLMTGNRLASAERKVSDQNSSFVATVTDSLSGFSVIKSFQAEKPILELFRRANGKAESAKCQKRKIGCVIGTIGAVAGAIAQFGVFIAGAYLALSGSAVTAGVVIAFVNLMNFVIEPIGKVPEILAAQKASKGLIEKLAAALENHVRDDEGRDIPNRLSDSITVSDLSFSYDKGQEVLHRMNYRFEAGKSYAIVGASGSGKSTLLSMLMAAHHGYDGTITYDGVEVKQISSRSLYRLVSLIEQNVFVFNASIRDNITMFREFPREEVDRVIGLAGLSDLIARRGEDYLCGENGSGLSGGEKQRISIARSLLRKSSVLLVDEATAALDAETANQVSESILGLENLTRIVVTHSLEASLLSRYDGILALKSGRIAETGSFEELMEKKGYFYSLYTVAR